MNNDILAPILGKRGIKTGALTYDFYIKNDITHVYDYIFETTKFLNDTDATLRERIFYVQNNYSEIQQCSYCQKKDKLGFDPFTLKLRSTCCQSLCMSKHQSIANTGNRLVPRKKTICVGCGKLFEQLPSLNKRYCTQPCWTAHNNEPHSEEHNKKLSESNKRTHNSPEYREGRKEIDKLVGKKLSIIMKEKIQNGKFTPCITNSWTKRTAFIELNGIKKKFRSNWEAAFWVINQHLEYEKLRIKYIFNDKSHNYIVDFVDTTNKIMYEIKPDSLLDNERNRIKRQYAEQWAIDNNYEYVIISNDWFIKNIDKINFDVHSNLYPYMKQFMGK